MKELKSDHIVKMYDCQGDTNYTYIILEFCGDGDLSKFISKHNGQLTEA